MIWNIAWKNVWRNKIRSLVVITAIAIGMFGGIFTSSVMIGMNEQRFKTSLENEISHIRIRHKDFSANREPQFQITNYDSVITQIKKIKYVNAVAARTEIIAMAGTSRAASGVMVYGVNPESEKQINSLFKLVCDSCGSYLDSAKANQIFIGEGLAHKLKAKIKSKIVLTFQHTDGNVTGGAFKVAGIYKTGTKSFDDMNVYVRNSDLLELNGMQTGNTHNIFIKLNSINDLDSTVNVLRTAFPQYEIHTWRELQPELAIIYDMMDFVLIIVIGIILLALGFGIVNTMLMVVLERIKELGMLMAVGMNKIRVFYMIMLETVFLTFTGGVIGMLVSGIVVKILSKTGLNIQAFGSGYESMGWDSFIYPVFEMYNYVVISVLVILTGILSSVYPAIKALKLKPVEAIRTDN